jgi:hypothetical protein
MLADGRLHLSGAGLIAPHLTSENRASVLARAAHRSKRQIEELVAELAPRPEVPATIRKLPECRASTAAPPPAPATGGEVSPPSEDRRSGESGSDGLCPDRVPAPPPGRHSHGPLSHPNRPAPDTLRLSSPSPPPATACSSPPARRSATSWSSSRP